MNDYGFTFTPEGCEKTETVYITERTEAAARKAFIRRFGKNEGQYDVELAAANTNATKDQERETLVKIKEMVAELGPDSYLKTAFDGVFEDAEQNIELDAAFSMKGRAETAEEKARELESQYIAAKLDASRLKAELDNAYKQIAALQGRQIPVWLHSHIYTLATEELTAAREGMAQAAEAMAQLADTPQDTAFAAAVQGYRAAKERRGLCEQIVAGLEDLSEK